MPNMSIEELEKALRRNPDLGAPDLGQPELREVPALKRPVLTEAAPLEYVEQARVITWADNNLHKYPALRFLLHVPNGGKREQLTAAILKGQGVRKGVPDLLLLCPTREMYCGLAIEMKRADGVSSDVSKEQAEWLTDLGYVGWRTEVCFGAAQAIALLESYCQSTDYAGHDDESNPDR